MDRTDSLLPRTLGQGRYRVTTLLGRGGEGTVVLAHDEIERRDVVLKWRHDESLEWPDEFHRLTGVDIPGVVRVVALFFDAGLGRPVLVEEHVAGRHLGHFIGKLDRPQVLELGRQLLHAIARLHRRGIRHGDVKPSNIVIETVDDHLFPVLVDFGMATALNDPLPGSTPAYLAPEVRRSDIGSPEADWFALGISLDEVARGRRRSVVSRRNAADDHDDRDDDELGGLVRDLLIDDPRIRAEAIRRRLDLDAVGDLPSTSRLPFVGRDRALDDLVRRIKTGFAPRLALVGPRGIGRHRLLEELAATWRTDVDVVCVSLHPDDDVETLVAPIATRCGFPLTTARSLIEAERDTPNRIRLLLERLAQRREVVVLVNPDAAAGDIGDELVASLSDTDLIASRLAVVIAVDESGNVPPGFDAVDVLPLEETDIALLVETVFRPRTTTERDDAVSAARTLHRMTRGHAGRLDLLVRVAVEHGAIGTLDGAFHVEVSEIERLALVSKNTDAPPTPLGPDAERLRTVLIHNGGALDRAALATILEWSPRRIERALGRIAAMESLSVPVRDDHPIVLAAAALLAADGDIDGIDDDSVWEISRPLLPDATTDEITRRSMALRDRLLPWLSAATADRIAFHANRLLAGRRTSAAAPVVLIATESLLAAGRTGDAAQFMTRSPRPDVSSSIFLPYALLEARLEFTSRGPKAAAKSLEAVEAVADHTSLPHLLVGRIYFELLAGELDAAGTCVERLDVLAANPEAMDDEARARAAMYRAVVFQRSGRFEDAERSYSEAAEHWTERGDVGRMAAADTNRAMLLLRSGRRSEARVVAHGAVKRLETAGSTDQLAAALTNLGVVESELRAADIAAAHHGRATRLFRLIGERRRAVGAEASRGIARLQAGRLVAARRDLEAALDAEPPLDTRSRAVAATHLARATLIAGRRRRARRAAALALTSARSVGADVRESARDMVRDVQTLRRLRPRHSRRFEPSDDRSIIAKRLRSADILERALGSVDAVLAATPHRGRRQGRRHLDRLMGFLVLMEQDMTTTERNVFRGTIVNPHFERLRDELLRILPTTESRSDARATIERLHRVRAGGGLHDALDAAAETVFTSTPAHRCVLVTVDDSGDNWRIPLAVVNDGRTIDEPETEISRHVIRDVIRERRTVVVDDASIDQRLGFAPSVQRLGLRSILCAPVTDGDHVVGALYVGTPLESHAFDAGHVDVVEFVADLVADAIGNDTGDSPHESARSLRDEVTSGRLELETRTRELRQARERMGMGTIIGTSAEIQAVNTLIDRVAPTDLSVLIVGETGVGKELVAQALHMRSTRRGRPFVAVNASALPEPLAESELFGHVRGAFTGAVRDEPGLFRLAHTGTLFLDEIGELSSNVQAKLLRVLESGRVRPVGGREEHVIDVRIVAATHRDLTDPKVFRNDLAFRLRGIEIVVPPLRERRDDIPLLARHFLGEAGHRFETAALEALVDFEWPGNVRQLRNVIERLKLLADDGVCRLTDLPEEVTEFRGPTPTSLCIAEERAIEIALRHTQGDKKAAAEILQISRSTLYEKIKRMDARRSPDR